MLKHIILVVAVAAGLTVWGGGRASGQPPQSPAPGSMVPDSAFFVGLGGAYSSVQFSHQNVYMKGTTEIFSTTTGVPIGSGSADGSVDPFLDNQFGLAPSVQAGYFQHFGCSDFLWGSKFSYSYLGATANKQNLLVPQRGSFTVSGSTSFTGNEEVALFKTTATNQFNLFLFGGYSFERSFIYFGGGPTLTQTNTYLNGCVGFADIDGGHTSITGVTSPLNFSTSAWVPGGALVVGATYFFTPSWFLDIGYVIGLTGIHSDDYSAPFTNVTSSHTNSGVNNGTYSGNLLTQSIMISINRTF